MPQYIARAKFHSENWIFGYFDGSGHARLAIEYPDVIPCKTKSQAKTLADCLIQSGQFSEVQIIRDYGFDTETVAFIVRKR